VKTTLVDTGILFAYLSADDQDHRWAVGQLEAARPPLLTCEAVVTETAYLLSRHRANPEGIWSFLRRGALKIALDLQAEFESVAALMGRYQNVPMDVADACLVRMSELHRDCLLLTTDSDFRIYRRYGRQVIPFVYPETA
jgi:predicted nucleic acid-binding protein